MSAIDWLNGCPGRTGEVWNPYVGCVNEGPGCDPCCALESAPRLVGNPHPAFDTLRAVTRKNASGKLCWNGQTAINHDRLRLPYAWKKPRIIFREFYGDPYFIGAPRDYPHLVADIMRANPHHEFLDLTKHPDQAVEFWQDHLGDDLGSPQNVWAGASIYNQDAADRMLPHLRELAGMDFKIMVSFEPLLGPVNLPDWLLAMGPRAWVIWGGQSAKKRSAAKRMMPEWDRHILDQMDGTGIARFRKQLGEYNQHGNLVGKIAAGHKIDGVAYREFPKSMEVTS